MAGDKLGALACGQAFCAALTETGQMYTWGAGDAGQLGYQVCVYVCVCIMYIWYACVKYIRGGLAIQSSLGIRCVYVCVCVCVWYAYVKYIRGGQVYMPLQHIHTLQTQQTHLYLLCMPILQGLCKTKASLHASTAHACTLQIQQTHLYLLCMPILQVSQKASARPKQVSMPLQLSLLHVACGANVTLAGI